MHAASSYETYCVRGSVDMPHQVCYHRGPIEICKKKKKKHFHIFAGWSSTTQPRLFRLTASTILGSFTGYSLLGRCHNRSATHQTNLHRFTVYLSLMETNVSMIHLCRPSSGPVPQRFSPTFTETAPVTSCGYLSARYRYPLWTPMDPSER